MIRNMWVTRDKDNHLFLWNMKPDTCVNGYWIIKDKPTLVHYLKIDNSLFPNLTWEDEPIEVEIVSKRFMDNWRKTNAFIERLSDLEGACQEQFDMSAEKLDAIEKDLF